MIIDHPQSFGARDRLTCDKCGGDTLLARRSPHPEFGGDYELQIFHCVQCGEEKTRSTDIAGHEHE